MRTVIANFFSGLPFAIAFLVLLQITNQISLTRIVFSFMMQGGYNMHYYKVELMVEAQDHIPEYEVPLMIAKSVEHTLGKNQWIIVAETGAVIDMTTKKKFDRQLELENVIKHYGEIND